MLVPSLVLGVWLAALIVRVTRTALLEALHREYINVARAKGLTERTVVTRHAIKNAFLPILTAIGLMTGYLLGGNIVVEEVFSLPGIGRLLLDAVQKRDYPLVQGIVLVIAGFVVLINLVTDLSYAYLDPRIRFKTS
jgi:peptide/nickel transport system permease protein